MRKSLSEGQCQLLITQAGICVDTLALSAEQKEALVAKLNTLAITAFNIGRDSGVMPTRFAVTKGEKK